jgi:uncharacterized protein
MRTVKSVLAGLLLIGILDAQQVPPAGHYEGTLKGPQGELNIALDLDKHEKLGWVGSIDINMPNAPKGLLAEKIAVDGDNVTWQLMAFGNATFKAKHDAGQKVLAGTASTPGGDVPFELKRTGDAKVNLPAPSTAITSDVEGRWEGTLEVGEQSLRLVLTFTNGPTGTAMGDVVSVDQGGAKIPMTTITQQGPKLSFELRSVGGSYAGTLNEAKTEAVGEWKQGDRTAPLTLKKQKPAETK